MTSLTSPARVEFMDATRRGLADYVDLMRPHGARVPK
jgi:hypothetical protein